MVGMGRFLIFTGVIIVIVGLVFVMAPKVPWLGRLPGDIYYRKDNFSFYFPITTSIIASLLVSLVVYLISRR
ncbi:MAG: DUF2905 domain-containing protein [Thermodesulfobacteriota bacterium]